MANIWWLSRIKIKINTCRKMKMKKKFLKLWYFKACVFITRHFCFYNWFINLKIRFIKQDLCKLTICQNWIIRAKLPHCYYVIFNIFFFRFSYNILLLLLFLPSDEMYLIFNTSNFFLFDVICHNLFNHIRRRFHFIFFLLFPFYRT